MNDSQDSSTTKSRGLLGLWLGVSQPVNRVKYTLSGFGLMLFKYSVEALVIWWFTSSFFSPWNFVNPVLAIRTEILRPAPEWVGWFLFVWSIPFLWIAISMSVRRAADAGDSPWLGLVVLVPLVNMIFMLVMCVVPSQPGQHWSATRQPTSGQNRVSSALLGIGASLLIGSVMLVASVYLLKSYGASLFLGTPLMMGATASFLFNRPHPRSFGSSMLVALTSVLCAGSALLLFALEGMICILMAAPLILPIGILGGIIGKAIADSTRRANHRELFAAIVVLPLLAGGEAMLSRSTEYEVLSAVEIEAPVDEVWHNVVAFPELPEPSEWYFRFGIASPQRARIVGQGLGATRYCEFTTGTFVEPITAWDEPKRLAFDVTDQPAPMFELSPYRHIHPPHLDGSLRSKRGEFRLVPLPDGRTRLEGRTWYEFDMFPQSYWTLWSDLLIHRIHERVLLHIKRESERAKNIESW